MPEYETEIKAILSVPSVAAVMPAYEHETEWTKQVRVRAIHAIALILLLLNTSLYCLSNKSSYSGYPHHFSPSCTFRVLTSVSLLLLCLQVASDCIWSDPASELMERSLDETGFGDSPRGGGAVW